MFKITTRTRGMSLRVLAAAACMLVLAGDGGGCSTPYPSQDFAKADVAVTQPSGVYQPGDTVRFRLSVTNSGPHPFNDTVIRTHIDDNLRATTFTCAGLGPSTNAGGRIDCGEYTKIFALAVGATATVDIVAAVITAYTPVASNRIEVLVTSGPSVQAGNTVTLANLPGAGYQALSADGQERETRIDTARATISFAGVTRPFTASGDGQTWRLPGGGGWRAPADLLVGTADLGTGVTPFIAARQFVASAAAIEGRAFNLFEIDTTSSGRTSRVGTALVSNSVMATCLDTVPHAIADCPKELLRQYVLSQSSGAFSGYDVAHFELVKFRVATSGGALVLLRGEAIASGRVFQVGLASNADAVTSSFEGGDGQGRWGTLDLAPSTLHEALTGADGAPTTFDGAVIPVPGGPVGLATATLGNAPSSAWLLHDGPLALVLGQPATPVDGLLQLFSR